MSDFQMFHTLGKPEDATDPSNTQQQVAPPQFNPAIAPQPGGYQQNGSFQQQQHQSQYQQYGAPSPGYGAPGAPMQQGAPQPDLSAQFGNMSVNDGGAAASAKNKKKSRHAFHTLEAPTASAPVGGGYNPAFGGGAGPGPGQERITPAMNQFPAPANEPFNPARQATAAEHAARPTGTQVSGVVDPDQIPSVPPSRDLPAKYYISHVYPTFERQMPPPASIPFVVHDQGNSSPKFCRLSTANIPMSSELLASTGLPLGLLLQPLAPLQDGEIPIPVLDFGQTGPPRCARCRAYVNPFMQFTAGGNKFVCNMCTFPNDVPGEYFSPLSPQGTRVDREKRPELQLGTVEFMVPREYWAKEPVPIRWLFVIDVSQEAYNKGLLESVCEGLLSALYGEKKLPEGSKVGIITFDKDVYFYNLSSKLESAQMMVVTDLEDIFVPLSDGLLVDPYESEPIITALLTRLPTLFSQVKSPEPALLPTLDAALSALEKTGGKILCSLSTLPTWGKGRLMNRDNDKIAATESERKLFTTEHPGFRKTAAKMVESGVGVDFFLASPGGGYLDIGTIGHVSAVTGGETFYYPNFYAQRDSARLAMEIKHSIFRETGFQALMKVRCSNGLQVSSYNGNFLQQTNGGDLEFGAIDENKAIGVMFTYDGKLDPKLDAHFQAALLYTTANGERRVRCFNIVASVATTPRDAMKFVDQDAVVGLIAKEAATRMTQRNAKEVRGALQEKCVDILAAYRKNSGANAPPGQLILPETLMQYGMYMLGLLKSRAFKAGNEPTDRRSHDIRLILGMGALELSLYLYPRIYSIHNLADSDGFPDENGHLRLPTCLRASFSKVQEGGAYLVDNGQICILWIEAHAAPNLLQDLFGESCQTLQSLDPYLSSLPVLETHLNAQVRNIIQYLATVRGSKSLTLQLARQNLDGAEYEFARMLVEDRNNEAQSYVDWLVHVHRLVQLEIAGRRSKEEENTGTFAGLRTNFW